MQNIEFKAELRDFDAACAQCKSLGAKRLGTLRQTDTYYQLPDGRLKRRATTGEETCWIYYHRPNGVQPRMSNYAILSDEEARRRWGTDHLRDWLVVTKDRDLWLLDNVRIHLDRVDGLGTFIEFEAVVSERFDVTVCHDSVALLRTAFEPILGEAISVSYCDLMAAHGEAEGVHDRG